ncbi:NUDIX hydrolase [Geomonas oryzisoli]|uniref:NUDIX hydrolase n=1 Tax=Geomonas oryzisoli TaxID=2847992 RepID=A0ABX8J3E5_9BACT|nr:NUDIX hydrolase [Geomonas oryzisoli]QWV92929.1 NUDIX hydrolase [Geomonas oryzisoli]
MTEQAEPRHTVVVGCLVRNDKNQVLMIRHRKRGWEIPQGRVEESEDLLAAVRREVAEEAGVEVEVGPLAAVWSMVSPGSALIFAFLGRYLSGELNPTDDSEEAAWVDETQALEMVTSPVMRERLAVLLNHDGSISYRSYSLKPYQLHLELNLLSWPQ